MAQANHPDKAKVREVMQRHTKERTPPMTPEQFRRELGWHLIQPDKRTVR